MRKLTLFLFLIFGTLLSAQTLTVAGKTLPTLILSKNDTVGIAFSLIDAREIDKKLEILHYSELLNNRIDTEEFNYITLINDLKVQNTLFKYKIITFIGENAKKDEIITDYKKELILSDEQNSTKDKIIINNNKTIKSLKTQKEIGIYGGVVLLLLLILK